MAIKTIIKKNTYFDSVSLMTISTRANQIEGVEQVNISMGTAMNKDVLKNTGLYTQEVEGAGNGDVMIVVEVKDGYNIEKIEEEIEEALLRKDNDGEKTSERIYSSIEGAARDNDNSNIAIISVPGQYAYREARQALRENLHVMIFSDNVTIEEEKTLKEEAHEKGLFMMGPDCGTAIINGKGLCFANDVRRGRIGIVAASGTGAQEVSVRIDDFGGGVSQLIGTGGRDLSAEIGGIMMLDGISALLADDETDIIILVSKPPSEEVAKKIYKKIEGEKKPFVVCFIGGDKEQIEKSGAYYAKTTKQAALKAVMLSGVPEEDINKRSLNLPLIEEVKSKLLPEQKYVRGLFAGGTISEEFANLLEEYYGPIYSNFTKNPQYKIGGSDSSKGHTVLDFGDDEFTRGRAHPMIDPTIRLDRIVEEASDPEVGVIALDIILGYGAHEDPVGATLPAIKKAKAIAEAGGRHIEILAFVLGTQSDPQNFNSQVERLMAEGVTISSSSENTGLLARGFVEKEAQ